MVLQASLRPMLVRVSPVGRERYERQGADLRRFRRLRSLTLGGVMRCFWLGKPPQLPTSLTTVHLEGVAAVVVRLMRDRSGPMLGAGVGGQG